MNTASISSSNALSLQTYVQVVRRQRRLIGIVAVLLAVLSMLPALLAEAEYAGTSEVRISTLEQEGVFDSDAGVDSPSDRTIELVTEMEIIGSNPIRAAVMAQYDGDVPNFEGPEVELVGFSQIVQITVTAGDAVVASDLANAFAEVYVEDRRTRSVEALEAKANELREQSADATTELERISQRLRTVSPNSIEVSGLQIQQATLSAQVLDFNRRADELSVEAALRGRGTDVHEAAAIDLTPRGSNPWQAGTIGLLLGVLLGLAIAVVVDTFQDRVSSREDLATARPDVPVLTAVPHADLQGSPGTAGFAVQEAFRYLRTAIRVYGLNSTVRSLLVTSAIGAEGKTTTSVNLAIAMADAGDRVLLVDVDLRRPNLHKHLGIPNDEGVSSVILDGAPLNDVIHFVRDNLAVITAGPPVQNPTEVLGSEQFARMLASLVEQADFTILDSPPVLPVADALLAGQQVDGTVVVSRMHRVRRREVRELLARLEEAQVSVIGLVANDTTEENPYGYYDSDTPADDRAPAGLA